MGLKGINPFERHVEKIVVGISGVALLGVLAMQFVGGSSLVKVGRGAPVPPADAYKPVEQEAERLIARLESGRPELPEAPRTEILALFDSKLTTPVAPRPGLVPLGPAPAMTQLAEGPQEPVDTALAPVVVPAPGEPVAHAFRSTISPFEWFGVEELRRHLPAKQPFDKAAVSVEAVFDGAAFKQALTEDPDGDEGPMRPLPLTWWRDGVEVVGVELEREQMSPDGAWGNATVIKGMPGRPDLIAEAPRLLNGIGDVNPFLARVRNASEQVMRPAYYETIAGPKWVSPVEARATADEGQGQGPDALLRKVERLDRTIADIESKMAQLPNQPPAKRDPRDPGGGGRSGGGDGGGGGKGGSGGGGARPGGGGPSPEVSQAQGYGRWVALNKTLQSRQAERDAVVEQLAKQGLDPLGNPLPAVPGAAPKVAEAPLLENESVKVWAHDITVEPGAMYRYRARIVVNNPMFGRAPYLLDEQKPLAEAHLVRGEWSEWGSPVQVDANGYFFIVSASEQDAVAGKRATAELYQFYYGYWRKGAVNVEPGDPLFAEAKLPPELPIFDLSKLSALPRPTETARVPGGEDGGDDGGGRRGVAPGGDDGGGRGRAAPPPEPTPAPGTPGEPPAGVTFAPAKMAVGVDALFLDVAPVPSIGDRRLAAGGGQLQAFLRDASGRIITRIPDHERKAEAYRRVSESARAGETQGKPVVRPVTRPDLPPPPPGRTEPDRRPDGGGGGGGGGG